MKSWLVQRESQKNNENASELIVLKDSWFKKSCKNSNCGLWNGNVPS